MQDGRITNWLVRSLAFSVSLATTGGLSSFGTDGQALGQSPIHNQPADTAELAARLEQLESMVHLQNETIQQQQFQIESMLTDEYPTYTIMETEPEPPATSYPKTTIGGQYRLMYNSSNFSFHQPFITDQEDSATYFNQRFRTWLTIQTSENVRGYLQAEMGHILWGDDDLDFPKSLAVGPLDRSGVEMRYGYLEYESQEVGLLRAGIQGWDDPFGQVLASADWDFSVGGLRWKYDVADDVHFNSGIFQLAENNVRLADDTYLIISDLDFTYSDEDRLGVSAYYLQDKGGYSYPTIAGYDSSWDMWMGLRGTKGLGVARLNGFALYNTGARKDGGGVPTYRHDGVALKLELAGIEIGPGKFSTQALYSTGNRSNGVSYSNEFRTIAQSARDNFGSQGYWSYLIISSPHGPSDVEDLGVSLQNRGLGLFTWQSRYEIQLSERFSTITSAGWLQSDARNPANGSTSMGTELVQAFRYSFGHGLATDFGAAVLYTGDFYKQNAAAARPDDLYEVFTRVQLDF